MSSPDDRSIRSICVLGGGIVALSAAIVFARALPKTRVTLLQTDPDPAALADRMPGSLPTIGRFHAALGMHELDLVRSGAATHRLGTRFEGWSANGEPWYLCFGEYGAAAGAAAFHQIWLRARRAGKALPFQLYSAAAMMAEAGKFVHPEDGTGSPLSTYLYALRLDPDRYLGRIEARAQTVAFDRLRGSFRGAVERRADGGVAAILTADGRRIEADLYLDCGGPSAPLLSALDSSFEDWRDSLPVDRLMIGETRARTAPASADRVVALPSGWRWEAPLSDRTLVGFASSSAITDDEAARGIFTRECGAAEPEMLSIRPGRRPNPWIGNVLALGDSSVALDCLEWTNLDLAHSHILLALELLPGRDCHPLELREYNRRSRQISDRVRDFVAAHYLACPRSEGAFWTGMGERPVPASLERTLVQFRRRGRLPFFEEETFDKQSWTALLIGMGVTPEQVDPTAEGVEIDLALAGMQRLAGTIEGLVPRLPPYRDYLLRMVQAPVR